MQTKKLPEPQEWWVSNDGERIAYICGFDPDGDPVCLIDECSKPDIDLMSAFLAEYHHEPLCDSFDWKPAAPIDPGEGFELLPRGTVLEDGDEFSVDGGKSWIVTCNPGDKVRDGIYRRRKPVEQWPKYYDVIYPEHAYIKRLSETHYVVVNTDGTSSSEYRWHDGLFGGRKEITKDEAMNNLMRSVKPAIPIPTEHPETPPVTAAVESPDDWVTQDRVLARDGIDQRRYIYSGDPGDWDDASQIDWPDRSLAVHGADCGDCTILELRCRRRDLPPLPRLKRTDTSGRDVTEEHGLHDETDIVTKCIPVRLWVRREMRSDSGRYYVSLKISPPSDGFTYDEIKIGPDGFYVESNTNDG